MKKQIIISLLFLILLAGIVIAIPAAETLFGVKIFNDGIKIGTDPNNAFLSNGNIMAKTIYSNGATVATLDANSKIPIANSYTPDLSGYVPFDANSCVADSAVYDKHTNLTSSSLTLGSLTIIGDKIATPADPNTAITTIKIVNGWGVVKCGVEKQHFTTDPNGTVTYDYKTLNSSNTKDTASNLNVYNDPNMALCFQNKTADPNAYIKYEIKY